MRPNSVLNLAVLCCRFCISCAITAASGIIIAAILGAPTLYTYVLVRVCDVEECVGIVTGRKVCCFVYFGIWANYAIKFSTDLQADGSSSAVVAVEHDAATAPRGRDDANPWHGPRISMEQAQPRIHPILLCHRTAEYWGGSVAVLPFKK